MWIKQMIVRNLRCFEGEKVLDFSKNINIFIGENSSGKSTLLKSIGLPEDIGSLAHAVRKKTKQAEVEIYFENADARLAGAVKVGRGVKGYSSLRYVFPSGGTPVAFVKSLDDGSWTGPINYNNRGTVTTSSNIYFPFLSRRKSSIEDAINDKIAMEVRLDSKNLYARLQLLLDSGSEFNAAFENACRDILGYRVHTFSSGSGITVGLRIDDENKVALTEMGEGVISIMGMLVNIFSNEKRIFVIEELENDLHPGALKMLLDLILDNADRHQFFISTHSSLVLRHLSANNEGTKIFEIKSSIKERLPTSEIHQIPNEPEHTLQISRRLGGTLVDNWLFDGYLILEESSAESVINDVLIPHFVPKLKGRLKTISSKGTGNLHDRYVNAQSLFLFAHLSPVYRSRCWVRADSGGNGRAAIEKLRASYSKYADFFACYPMQEFEYFYPHRFSESVAKVMAISDPDARRAGKAEILREVLKWANENPGDAQTEFSQSAKAVIDDLISIGQAIDAT